MGLSPSPQPAPDDSRTSLPATLAGSSMKRHSPVFTRVRRTSPMFTFNLPEPFVNDKSAISTDICRFLSEMFPFKPGFSGFLRCDEHRGHDERVPQLRVPCRSLGDAQDRCAGTGAREKSVSFRVFDLESHGSILFERV